jgi:hypothetical protein
MFKSISMGSCNFYYAAFGVQRSGWTKDMDVFLSWLSGISFSGGGFSEAATCEGLADALTVFMPYHIFIFIFFASGDFP